MILAIGQRASDHVDCVPAVAVFHVEQPDLTEARLCSTWNDRDFHRPPGIPPSNATVPLTPISFIM